MLLNNPAVVPATDANGIVKAIAGVVVAFVTVDVNVLPLAVTVIGFTFVTVPPVPVAVKFPFVKLNPEPMVTSPGAAALEFVLPNNLPAVIFCIFAYVTAEFAIVDVNVPVPVPVTSPVNVMV